MKVVLSFVAACFLAAVVLWQLAHRNAERGLPGSPSDPLASSSQSGAGSAERRTPVRRETNAAAASATGKPSPASLAALPAAEKHSLEEQIRLAQNWFAYAGNTSNGSPRLVASVRGQKFDFVAEDCGVSVRPWTGATNWSWRMASGDAANVAPKAEKTRATYARGAGVTEWFENGERGVEQGFTLDTASADKVRRMPLRVTTELKPMLRPDADGVDFVDASGNAQLHYDGLHAFDADGKKLRAWVEMSEGMTRPHPQPLSHPMGEGGLEREIVKASGNPKGIVSSSPGLRGTSYPGETPPTTSNPNGVASPTSRSSHNPVGVEFTPTVRPR